MANGERFGWEMAWWPLLWRRVKDVAIFGAGWYLLWKDQIPLEPTTIPMVLGLWGLIPLSWAHSSAKKDGES